MVVGAALVLNDEWTRIWFRYNRYLACGYLDAGTLPYVGPRRWMTVRLMGSFPLSSLTLIRCRCILVEVPFFLTPPAAHRPAQVPDFPDCRSQVPQSTSEVVPSRSKSLFPPLAPPIPHLSCFSPSLHRHSLPLCDRFFPFFFPFTFFFFPLSHSLDILNIQPSRYPSLFPGPLLSFRLDITTHPQSPRPHPF